MYNCIYYVHMYMFLSLLYNHDMCRLMFSYAPSPPPPTLGVWEELGRPIIINHVFPSSIMHACILGLGFQPANRSLPWRHMRDK